MPHTGKRPTVKDVAAEAGVAVMTVSYTFSRPDRVAEGTRARVLEAADRLGYRQPDSTARALRSGRTGQLGVVVGEHLSYAFDDPHAAQFLAGVADVCVEHDLGMMLIPTHGAETADATRQTDVDRVLSAAVDAYVLWTTSTDDPVLTAVASSGRPAAIQGGPTHPGIRCVASDDRAAAAAVATAALAASPSGAVPVILSFPLDHNREARIFDGRSLPASIGFPVTNNRLAGYRDALTAHGYDWDAITIAVANRNHRADGDTAARALLDTVGSSAPLVVLGMSDELALGATPALRRTGRHFRATGWDASPEARAAGIISVTNPLREQGRLCARAALDPELEIAAIPWSIATGDEALR